MSNNYSNTKRIAKNTIVLYFRMAIIMCITLFTSRIVLKALGVSDFGLYNVVAGVVGLVSFLRTSLTSSTQRFISYELGRGDEIHLRKVFSVCVSSHALIALIIFIIAEAFGVWFLNTYLQIPEDRYIAANWIYQFAIVSLCVSTITVPYSADVISHEEMTCYAIITMIEAVLKLGIAYSLLIFHADRLILYGALMACIDILDLCMYFTYCRIKHKETQFQLCYDKPLFKKVFSFSGWTILGQLSVVGANQGTSILVNMYYSVVANAAIGVAQQINNAITGLTSNFQTAFQPQITKSYAAKDYSYMNSLIGKTSKISFFLLFLVSLPIMFNINFLLDVWLEQVPEYADGFAKWFIIASLFNALSAPLWISVYASGDIKSYQILVSSIFFSDILIVLALFRFSEVTPVAAVIVKAFINLVVVFVRLFFAKKSVPEFSINDFLTNVVVRILIVSLLCFVICILFKSFGNYEVYGFLYTMILVLVSFLLTFFVGFSKYERDSIIFIIKKRIRR